MYNAREETRRRYVDRRRRYDVMMSVGWTE